MGFGTGTLTGNYAWDGMTVENVIVAGGQESNVNGADLSYTSTDGLSEQFSAIFGNDSAWKYTQNGLPTLKDVGGNQSSALPSYMTVGAPSTDIYTVADLQALATWVNSGGDTSGETYTLKNDLDLSGVEWTPIGESGATFQGIFDGNGHVISNLTINNPTANYQGLFGYTDGATIQKLGIENCDVSGYYYVGALVGYANDTDIEKCYSTGALSGSDSVGGLVASAYNNSTIQYCYSTATVSGGGYRAGGLVGSVEGGSTVSNCYATGIVIAPSADYVGGLVGYAHMSAVENSLALTTSVSGTSYLGRVVGFAVSSTLTNNYAWKDMLVNGVKVTDGTTSNENGGDLFVKDGIFVDENGDSIYENTAIFDSNIWYIPTASNKDYMLLPTLDGVGDDVPSIYLSQTLEYEAEIGSKGYKSLEAAVSAAQDNDTITLLADVELEAVLTISTTITLDLNGFDIKQTASSASVISVVSSGNLTMKDSGSSERLFGGSGTQGGGINVTGALTLSGGTITENTASSNGGGIYVSGSTFKLSGLVNITGNTVNSEPNNVFLTSGKTIAINGDLNTNSRIGITTEVVPTIGSPVVFTSGASSKTTSLNNFTSDNPDYKVVEIDSGEYALAIDFTLPTFSGGDGSISAPYIITTQRELEDLATVVNNNLQNSSGKNYNKLYYELGNNIDIGSNTNWTPIGTGTTFTMFDGHFDGAGFEVQNLTITTTTSGTYGLFGSTATNDATIANLNVSGNISVSSNSNWITLGGIIGSNKGLVDSCHSSMNVTLASTGSSTFVGGIAGQNSYGIIRNSSNSGSVRATGKVDAGGIAGSNYGGEVENCYNQGVIYGEQNVGGILGQNSGGYTFLINSYSSSTSVTGGSSLGAMVGHNLNGAATINCYWLSNSGVPTDAIGTTAGTGKNADLVPFDTTGALTSDVTIDSADYSTVLSALNAWVDALPMEK